MDRCSSSSERKWCGSQLLKEEIDLCNRGIVTFSEELDKLLGGGILPGTITEVVGDKGTGKTTFCLQMCLNVQIPEHLNGVGSEAIYIDAEHSLSAKRLAEMAGEFVFHCNGRNAGLPLSGSRGYVLSSEAVMSRIHIVQCCDNDELARIILSLKNYLAGNPRVKLIVIDSIAFPMYTQDESFENRAKVLYAIGQELFQLINKFSLAVIITNNMTTRIGEDGEEIIIPYLGDSWAHIANQRLMFSWTKEKNARKAELVGSNCNPLGSTSYRITAAGFRD